MPVSKAWFSLAEVGGAIQIDGRHDIVVLVWFFICPEETGIVNLEGLN